MAERVVAWWNVENLFDHENAPRSDKLQRAIGSDLAGWTVPLRDRKLDQLASVIVQLGNGAGPDLVGVCEIENYAVLDLLRDRIQTTLGRSYAIEHADLSDKRGIDVAFLYDPDWLTVPNDATFHHVVMRRTGTREIVQVNFQTAQGRTLTVFGNHWPSRAGGAASESEGYREIAGETLAYFHERAKQMHGSKTPVLVMGDFNDEPFDSSLAVHALSVKDAAKVVRGRSPWLLNMMWPLMGDQASYVFESTPNMLDQFLVNKNMLINNRTHAPTVPPIRIVPNSAEVVALAGTFDDEPGSYREPVRFGGHGKDVNEDGFSDHLPIQVRIIEDD